MTKTTMEMVMVMAMVLFAYADDKNNVFQPCDDAKIQKSDGFTFGIAFAPRDSFFFNQTQLSPCDRRLPLSSANAQLAVFRPKVDEISLLTVNSSTFSPGENWNVVEETYGGYMVAFAGRKYAARSPPSFVANTTYIITSSTLVLEFQKGTLQNLYWKRDGCASCKGGNSSFVCLNQLDCAIRMSSCKSQGGPVDCSLSIQLAFSGTDKHDTVLNSWYEVKNLQQYSLFNLYSNLKDSLTSQYNKFL